jgi:broad specificity phosphatase PhoE
MIAASVRSNMAGTGRTMPANMRATRACAALLLATLIGGCAGQPARDAGATFVLVRHAEKADDGSKDPPLSDAGAARARVLSASLASAPLRAAYATGYRRTQATATPSAQSHALPVITYDASRSAADLAAQLRRDHRDGTVLVVGHSNTVPAIAAALCGCRVAPMADGEFDRRITIAITADGEATLREERY